ncbi:MAG: glutamate racemase [Petrotoga sp.]|jgi:glutamate racemase|nr:glutamate racemase [Petrotoga sp.]
MGVRYFPIMKIGLFDSGIGGLTVLKKVIENFGNHEYFYLADNLNVPYGSKPISFLRENLKNILSFFNKKKVDLLISACNTTDSIVKKTNFDTKNYSFSYVSIIDNAIKTIERNDSVLLLATENTINLGAYKEALIKKKITNLEEKACPLFVPLIEEGYWDGQMAESVLRFYLQDSKSKYHKVILGCTHYPILEKQIRKYTNSSIVDPADGIVGFLKNEINLEKIDGKIRVNYLVTGNTEKFKLLSKIFMKDVKYHPIFKKIELEST